MSEFNLDVDSPFPKPSKEIFEEKPERLNYPQNYPKYRFYGNTIKKVYDNIEKLNEFKTINGNLNYNLDFTNFNLFEYDYYSIYAFTLYNHTNFDINIKNDKNIITNLNSKYNIV